MQQRARPRRALGERRRGRRDEPGHGARAHARRRRTPRRTATSTRRATSSPTPRRCSPPASSARADGVHRAAPWTGGRVTGVRTSAGDIATPRVVLTGGPTLAAVGAAAGVRIPAGGARHQVVVTEAHPDFAPERLPMVFDLASGIYWRPCEGGVLWGMSNPEEAARARPRSSTTAYLRTDARADGAAGADHGEGRAAQDVGGHHRLHPRPPADPRARRSAPTAPIEGTVVAAAGGHGMMWGPGVSRAAADLALTGTTDVVDVTDLGLDRFDEQGRSRLDPRPHRPPLPHPLTRSVSASYGVKRGRVSGGGPGRRRRGRPHPGRRGRRDRVEVEAGEAGRRARRPASPARPPRPRGRRRRPAASRGSRRAASRAAATRIIARAVSR